MKISPFRHALTVAVSLAFSFTVVQAQDDVTSPSSDEPGFVAACAETLLQGISPSRDLPAQRERWKVMERAGGSVRWGNFFRPDRIVALVSVPSPGEDIDSQPLREKVCYFEWADNRWIFRQFLGDAGSLEVNYREDSPSVFLQGSFRTGRHAGEFVSWFLDEQGRLVPTGLEEWGPFYLAGDYLVSQRGFERKAQDSTWWVHGYRDGKKDALLARFHQTDSGDFDITSRDEASGEWRSWIFTHDPEDPSRMSVTVSTDLSQGTGGEPEVDPGKPVRKGEIRGEIDSNALFEMLTGLDPTVLELRWLDELPARAPLACLPLEISGDPEILARLRGRDARKADAENQARMLRLLQDIVPDEGMTGSASLAQRDIRGVWGRIFGDDSLQALLALGMAVDGESDGPATLYHFRWEDGKWALIGEAGNVSAEIGEDGAPIWTVRRQDDPPTAFVIDLQERNWIENSVSWRYDPSSRTLQPTGWPRNKIPSISGDTITFVWRDPVQPGNPPISEVYRFDGTPGAWIGTVCRDLTDDRLLRAAITVPADTPRKMVTWRIWKTTGDYLPQSDVYTLCRDEDDGRGPFHADATIEFDWDADFGDEDAAKYIWSRLTKTGVDSYLGEWAGDSKSSLRTPKTVKVTGLPEAAKLFARPEK